MWAKRVLKSFGKFVVFLLLNGLGGALAVGFMIVIIGDRFAWLFGQAKTGTPYGDVVEVTEWGLWGLFGAYVAVSGYSIIFKQFPPRWMGITFVSIGSCGWILLTAGIIFSLSMGEEIELEIWKEFAHATASISTFWLLFGLPPLPHHDYTR